MRAHGFSFKKNPVIFSSQKLSRFRQAKRGVSFPKLYNRNPIAASGSSSLQNIAAAPRLHPLHKTEYTMPATVMRLESSLHYYFVPSGLRLSVSRL